MSVRVLHGDCREILPTLPAESVNCCVTSPPYWGLRSYLPEGVSLKAGAPASVRAELESLGIEPIDHTVG